MWYVYVIRSSSSPREEYTGATADLKQRVADHNVGKSAHTAKFIPWDRDKHQALEFERYLKSHSGRAFGKKRLL